MTAGEVRELARSFYRLGRLVLRLAAWPSAKRSTFTELAGILADGVAGQVEEERAYQISERLVGAVYPHYLFSEYGRTWLDDEAFRRYYQRFMDPGNWHSIDRKFALCELLKLCRTVPGDTVECGAYKGATSYLICREQALNGAEKHRHHFVFDSFAGLSEPDGRDGSYWTAGDLQATEEDVRAALAEFSAFTILPGWIPERFAEVENQRFAFVHIDVDLYQPTRDSIEFFYPRLNPGGILLLDDYGFRSCPGATAAADEFFTDKDEAVANLPTGQGVVVKAVGG